MTDVAVLGAGSWGTVLADLLARKGLDACVWAFEPDVAAEINSRHRNSCYLPGAELAATLRADADIFAAIDRAPIICSVTPSHVARDVWAGIAPRVAPGTRLVCGTKGIEVNTLALMSGVAAEALPQASFVALSGPSFAEEVHAGQPTAIVAASGDGAAMAEVQHLFSTRNLRVYSNRDVTGVLLGGALKNTMAIAAGVLDGMGMGNNPRAALLTRGLAEIARLGEALGAEAATFSGLAGMGDLILTCLGALSRNRQLGLAIAGGATLAEYQATHRTVVEGANAALAASRLARRHGVEMPIAHQVAAILFEQASPRESIQLLMERTLKAERW
ncbi:MAG: NAD(P)H-dependent glycerol-3-phosphate dehydrogenase [Gemmatimonadales bacterium]